MPATPFSVAGTLTFPPDAGAVDSDKSFPLSGSFNAKLVGEIPLTGAGTVSLNLQTLANIPAAGCKLILLKYDAGAAAPINVQINAGGVSGQLEVSAAGFFLLGSPNPTAGITQLDIVHTQDGNVRVWALG